MTGNADSILMEIFMTFVARGETVDADKVHAAVRGRIPEATLKRKMGVTFRKLKAARVLTPCGAKISDRREQHGALIQIWCPVGSEAKHNAPVVMPAYGARPVKAKK